jgi:hypothetical protein
VPDPPRLPPMGGLAPEPAASPDWEMMRTDALTFIAAALYCSEDEAQTLLLDYACRLPPSAWRCRPRVDYEGEDEPFDPVAVCLAIPVAFWPEVREGVADVKIEGNSATYHGPPFWRNSGPAAGRSATGTEPDTPSSITTSSGQAVHESVAFDLAALDFEALTFARLAGRGHPHVTETSQWQRLQQGLGCLRPPPQLRL